MHLDHPIAQRTQDVVAHHRMVRVDGVAGAGIVLVIAPVVAERVEDCVIDAAEGQRWTQLVRLGRMIEYHVQNHFDAGLVAGSDHLLEFHLLLPQAPRAAVRRLGSAEHHGIVSPVILERLAGVRIAARARGIVELQHGHQLQRSHAQALEVRKFFDQAPVGSRMIHSGTRMNRESADVGLIDDGL